MAGRRRARFPIAGRDYLLPFSKFGQASAPTSMDDELDGFTNGSEWHTTAGDAYRCVDPSTGAAVWERLGTVESVQVSGGTTGLSFSGGPITGAGTITLAGTLGVPNGGTGTNALADNSLLVGNGTAAVEASSYLLQTATGLQIGSGGGSPTIDVSGGDSGVGSIRFDFDGATRFSFDVDDDNESVSLVDFWGGGGAFNVGAFNSLFFRGGATNRVDLRSSGTSADPAINVHDTAGVIRASISGAGVIDAESFVGDGSGLTDLTTSELTPIDTGLLGNNTGTIQAPFLVTTSQLKTMLAYGTLADRDNPTTTRGDLIVRDNAGDLVRLPVGAANTVLAGGTDPAYSTITALLDSAFGSTRGMLLYRGASAWLALAAGTAGNKLQTNGSSADPSWESDAVGGSVSRIEGSTSLAVTGTINLGSAATWVEFEWITPGGGGGSGRRGASGSSRFGGFGGYGGHYSGKLLFKISDLGLAASTIYYEVNTSGAGGGLTTSDNTNGAAGTDGGTILIRKDSAGGTLIVKGYGGRGGAGGTNVTTAVAAVTGYGIERGGAGGQPIVTGTADVGGSTFRSGAGGQAGTSLTSGNATLAGGAAGTAYFADGATPITNTVYGGSGATGVGVAGGKYGAGGRGGDAVLNGSSTNTAGTAGGVGILVVRYW